MKHPLIQLLPDKVTISEQGKAAARKWQAGDKPFIQFLDEAESASSARGTHRADPERVEEVAAVQADEEAFKDDLKAVVKRSANPARAGDQMTLDIGSRLEIEAPTKFNNFVIRSITRVNMGDSPQSYETYWEIIPEESD